MTTWEQLPLPNIYRIYDNARNLHLQEAPEQILQQLVEMVTVSNDSVNRQIHLQSIWILLHYADNPSNLERESNVKYLLDRFLFEMSEGEIQDSNLLEYIAHLFHKKGAVEQAVKLFRQAALSPSTFADHAISLALRHLQVTLEMGQDITDQEPLCLLIEDLLFHGYGTAWIENAIVQAMGKSEFPVIVVDLINRARTKVLSEFKESLGVRD
jgi:hypothetical protein